MPIRGVLWDLDDVLCHLDDDKRLEYLAKLTHKTHDELAAALWTSGFEDRSDSGKLTKEEYLKEFGERIGYPLTAKEWCLYRSSGMTPYPDVLQLAQDIAQTRKVAILTNNGHMLAHHLDHLFPELRPIFGKEIYVSAEFGCRKPSVECYAQACERMGLPPSEVFFTDDRLENILGARRAGLKAEVFSSAAQLRAHLT